MGLRAHASNINYVLYELFFNYQCTVLNIDFSTIIDKKLGLGAHAFNINYVLYELFFNYSVIIVK